MAAARRRQRRNRLIISMVVAVAIVVPLLFVAGGGGGGKDDALSAPKVTVPKGPAPTKLVKKDLKVGDGPAAKTGDQIEVNYVGITMKDGKTFDSTWETGQTATFVLEYPGLIEGWAKGIPGMKVGGRRQLIIPPALAYGETNPRAGGPDGPLLFVIDLVAIK